MADFYDRRGNPMTINQYTEYVAAFQEADDDYKRVALTDIGDVQVSTVWLGIDHNWHTGGPPLIFETMVFGTENEPFLRYPDEESAIRGHFHIVMEQLANATQDECVAVMKSMESLLAQLQAE